MTMTGPQPGFVVNAGRRAKALKIRTVLEEAAGGSSAGRRLLDVGTGNGQIAQILGQTCDVISIDPRDQRQAAVGYRYVRAGTALPFAGASFDLAVSNHVIEHLDDAASHLDELARVVRPGGLVYLATPNRLWPWEVHYRVWLLHWLPQSLFERALRLLGRYREPLHLLSLRQLRTFCDEHFDLTDYAPRITRWPARYHLEVPSWIGACLAALPLSIYRLFAVGLPTLVVVLRRR
ncbi:methyltransferase domain-containing protein [Immundisolibacter sp.]|uniref:methyltransferase domain-containing protein n=1 Tax=Immundisolibacter sp. TaxID=1934948 RepID=UPI0035679933